MTCVERVLAVRTLIGNRYPVFFAVSRGLNLESLLIRIKLWPDAICLVKTIKRISLVVPVLIVIENLDVIDEEDDDEEENRID